MVSVLISEVIFLLGPLVFVLRYSPASEVSENAKIGVAGDKPNQFQIKIGYG